MEGGGEHVLPSYLEEDEDEDDVMEKSGKVRQRPPPQPP